MKLISKISACVWYAMGGAVCLSGCFLAVCLLYSLAHGINEATEQSRAAAQVRQDNAEELRQAQLEWYRSHTDETST